MKKVVKLEMIPIKKTTAENKIFIEHPDCQEGIYITIYFFEHAGFHPPCIVKYAQVEGKLVGVAAFKGRPQAGKVEISYGTFPLYRK